MGGDHRWERWANRCWWLAVAALAGVVLVAGIRAAVSGWQPTGDDAFLTLRARDVFSADPPLLSTASSGGATSGIAYQHPGPVLMYLLAPFVTVVGSAGAALGTAALNAGWVVAIGGLLRRWGRPAVAGAVLGGVGGVVWAMGSEVLVDPWNPHAAVLPLALLAVAAWAAWMGSPGALVWGVLGATVAGQTHLSYGPPAAVGLALLAAGGVATFRRASRESDRSRVAGWAVVAVAVGLLSIVPPVVEQLAHGRDGNVARILRGSDFEQATVSAGDVVGVVADKVILPPWFLRGSWLGPLFAFDLPDPWVATLLVAGFAGLLAVSITLAGRRRDREVAVAGAVTAALAVAGALAAVWFPLRVGLPMPYFRWLWPAAALAWAAVAARPVELLAGRLAGTPQRRDLSLAAAWGLVVVATAVATVPSAGADAAASPPDQRQVAGAVIEEAAPSLEGLDEVFVEASGQEIALWLLPALIDDLDRRGVVVGVDDPVLLQQTGPARRSDGEEPWVLVTRNPLTQPDDPPPSWRRVAAHRPLDTDEHLRLEADTDRVVAQLEEGSVELTPRGREVAEAAELDVWLDIAEENPRAFVRYRGLPRFLDEGLLRISGVDEDLLRRVAELGSTEDDRTVEVWLVPRDDYEATS